MAEARNWYTLSLQGHVCFTQSVLRVKLCNLKLLLTSKLHHEYVERVSYWHFLIHDLLTDHLG